MPLAVVHDELIIEVVEKGQAEEPGQLVERSIEEGMLR